MHIEYDNTKEVRANLKRQIEARTEGLKRYTATLKKLQDEVKETTNTIEHLTAVLTMIKEDYEELEATKGDE